MGIKRLAHDRIVKHNRGAWDKEVEEGNPTTIPLSSKEIAKAKKKLILYLTPNVVIPKAWLPEKVIGLKVLVLGGGGGQHAPLFSAAGANVTLIDNSPKQLNQDKWVAEREGLSLTTVLGDMCDLSNWENEHFDLIIHPVSNLFIPDPQIVWRETYRVLRPGGSLISAFMNPTNYLFNYPQSQKDIFRLEHAIPYSDITSITEEQRQKFFGKNSPLEFGHSLDVQIGGQLKAGFMITGFFSDHNREDKLSFFIPTYFVTKAIK